jgi:hypothetical protein
MRGCGLRLGFWAGVATLLIVHLGTALPNAPANLGTYQLSCAAGLMLFGIDKTTAAGLSVVVFVVLTIPLWMLGALAFGQSGLTIKMVRRGVDQGEAESTVPAGPVH